MRELLRIKCFPVEPNSNQFDYLLEHMSVILNNFEVDQNRNNLNFNLSVFTFLYIYIFDYNEISQN